MSVPLIDTRIKARARILKLASDNAIYTLKNDYYTPTYGSDIVDLVYTHGVEGVGLNEIHYKKLLQKSPQLLKGFIDIVTNAFNELLDEKKIIIEDTKNPAQKRLKIVNHTHNVNEV